MTQVNATAALVTPDWLDAQRDDPAVRLVEIAGTGQEQRLAYKTGYVPGAVCWWWMDALWDPYRRNFPSPDQFAQRCGARRHRQ